MTKRIVASTFALLIAAAVFAQVDQARFAGMRWRTIGPFRGGRTVAAVGVRQQPNIFYIGVNNGGVWKTTDYGRVWTPIFDDQPTGSIGAIAVAPSDPNVLYVGSGEGLQRPDLSTGDGIYKSTDAGKTWTHLGLRDGQQIPAISVDPRDPNRLFVAVLGHPYGPNTERGIFRSTDGGATFEKVLYKDENTGAMDVMIDPSDPNVLYADLWEARQGPWENGAFSGPGSGFYKSTDGGATWRQITNGLPPSKELGRIGFDISRSDPRRLYAIVGAKTLGGVYRSDDAGESWTRVNTDERLWGRDGDFNEVRVDPKNADQIYIANVVTWQSSDGGKTFKSFRGAPGGDDYHRLWINPDDPAIILNASDQGAVITVNRGQTWSSWYNQPTAQMYHVNTDNAFPYRVCSGQQESGSVCVASRSDDGAITFRDWRPVAIEEYGYAVPDPLNPDIVYGGKLERFDWRTKQVQQIAPKAIRDSSYRVVRTMPIVFSPADPHILFFASNTVWKTTTGGKSWTQISPDLTRKTWDIPANVGKYAPDVKVTQRGVVYALAPSPLDVKRIWAGTDDGLIHATTDGGQTWKNVTPADLRPWAKVSIMEASHFDAQEAYAAINTFRLDDLRPHILRTRDGGKSWTEIVNGIPAAGIINAVREDPKTRGLLFAGSEREVYVSFDDGDHWQSLRLNMPASSIRDLTLHEDDLIAGTHGRGFWILDDIEPLRQVQSATHTYLFKPQRAWRFRWSKYPDTPIPPDEPMGQNPPDGAVIDYYLASAAQNVTLEILDGSGKVIRRYASTDKAEPPKDEGNIPWYWIRPPQVLSTSPGMHRFTWDLHYTPSSARREFPISAVPYNTGPVASSPWVLPSTYTVRLTADGQTMTQPLIVRMDPRVKTTPEGLRQQFDLSTQVYNRLVEINTALTTLHGAQLTGDLAQRAKELEGDTGAESGVPVAPGAGKQPETLSRVRGSLSQLLSLLQQADAAPTTQAVAAVRDRLAASKEVMKRWEALRGRLPKSASAQPTYHVARHIPIGGSGGWDYLTVDSASHRLFVSHGDRVEVIDTDAHKVVGAITGLSGSHGIAIAPDLHRGYITSGRSNTVTIFDTDKLTTIKDVKATGDNPDAILYDPFTQRIWTFNGRGQNATVFDRDGEVVTTVPIGGKPEFAVSDREGRIYVNVEDTNEVAAINAREMKVENRYALAPCESPTGLAIDGDHKHLFSVCANKMMIIINPANGQRIATAPIGAGVDGVAFDDKAHLAFTSNGGDGTITVVRERDGLVVDTVTTAPGARTIAVDENTRHVFVSTAKLEPVEGQRRPRVVDGTFEVLEIEP